MILEVDIGNSRIKWRVVESDRTVSTAGCGSHRDYSQSLGDLTPAPEMIRVASVVPDLEESFREWCLEQWGLEPKFAQVSHLCSGVTNAYVDVSQMGVDRWSAIVAAFDHHQTACLVIDVGSALTVDLLQADGHHIGGYIVPGLSLMREALLRHTGRVKTFSIDYHGNCSPGQSTQEAVAAGLRMMHLGLITQALIRLLSEEDSPPVLAITGGAAEVLLVSLKIALAEQGLSGKVSSVELNPWLVMDGLALLLPNIEEAS
ncbi:MAG: type III pantothenate kinase [Cellvibrionaceae bacterium]|jgi:type III pantothenate kinase